MTRIDHVALEIHRFDEQIDLLVDTLGLRLVRIGARYSTGQRIAMLVDDHGFKLELIEASPAEDDASPVKGTDEVFQHLAVRADDVALLHDNLLAAGASERRPPHRLDAAKADTSLVELGTLAVQVVRYDEDSSDLT
ncbi:MAG: VOC family protein [Ilumatobacter sp.]|jgi:catechol 2,3-dioxygenase-like lactoylglutathione lyase family enzyme|uniref:VOC family protein n=1 Tax=Ilumatobacter sp. TaxID=1967498 RepID=UPI00391C4E79